jgi:hypothetical protein
MPIDGSKYHYWKQRYISTGNLKAFDLMTRHYAADPDNCRSVEVPSPVGKHSNIYQETWPNLIHVPMNLAAVKRAQIERDHKLEYAGKFLGIDTYIDPDEPTDPGWHFETVTTKEGLL